MQFWTRSNFGWLVTSGTGNAVVTTHELAQAGFQNGPGPRVRRGWSPHRQSLAGLGSDLPAGASVGDALQNATIQ